MTTQSNISAPAAGANIYKGPAIQSEPGFATERPTACVARNVERHTTWSMPATPDRIFPLLCPVREYDWICGWRARLIHAPSGYAEDSCMFETRIAPFGKMTWVCTRYEPLKHIEYTTFSDRGLVIRLRITLCHQDGKTTILWDRSWHAINEQGEALLAGWDDEKYAAMMEHHRAEMEHYLLKGALLPVG